jgi:hypothetical protein
MLKTRLRAESVRDGNKAHDLDGIRAPTFCERRSPFLRFIAGAVPHKKPVAPGRHQPVRSPQTVGTAPELVLEFISQDRMDPRADNGEIDATSNRRHRGTKS